MTQPPSEEPTRRPSAESPEAGLPQTHRPAHPTDGATGEQKDQRPEAPPLAASEASAVGNDANNQRMDFSEIVPQFESALLRYVGQLLRPNDPEVEDIVQDAFLRLHRYVGKHGEGAVRNVQTWLYKVAHNLTMDTLRKRKVRKDGQARVVQDAVDAGTVDGLQSASSPSLHDASPGDGADALGQLEHREACQRAIEELHRLPEHQKEAVLLKLMQGMTIRQISEITGVSIGNVGYRINQGLAELSRRLKTAGVI